jgi:hypothetical protein
MSEKNEIARRIRDHLGEVASLRTSTREPKLLAATAEVKRLQSPRFRGTYADLLKSPTHAAAAQFFLEEL